MKKIFGIIILSLFWLGIGFADILRVIDGDTIIGDLKNLVYNAINFLGLSSGFDSSLIFSLPFYL